MTDTPDLERMKRRRARLAKQLSRLDDALKSGQGVYTTQTKENTVSTNYTRETPLVRWQLAECLLCGKPGIATRYPGTPPRVCDACYNGYDIKADSERAKARTKTAVKRRKKAGQPMPPPAVRIDE